MPESEKQAPDLYSKSQRKRDMHALQELGKVLTTLTEAQLDKIPISDELRSIVRTYNTLKTHESKRRHMQYLGKKMREVDEDAVRKAVDMVKLDNAREIKHFHAAEAWRDTLIAKGDDGLQELINQHPEADRQHLRQLIRKAQHDVKTGKNTGGALELFRYLRDTLKI